MQCLGDRPKSRDIEDLSEAFVSLARKDTAAIKSITESYVRQIKKEGEAGRMNPNSVSNKIKPIKALLRANEVDMSWGTVNRMFSRPVRSDDRAYTRKDIQGMLKQCSSTQLRFSLKFIPLKDIQGMLKQCSSLTDRLIVLFFSSAGFRVDAWNYCWGDMPPMNSCKTCQSVGRTDTFTSTVVWRNPLAYFLMVVNY